MIHLVPSIVALVAASGCFRSHERAPTTDDETDAAAVDAGGLPAPPGAVDAGTMDAGPVDGGTTDGGAAPPPGLVRPITPLATERFLSDRQTLRWVSEPAVIAVDVQICRGRPCSDSHPVETVVDGSSKTVALDRGVYFWRLRGRGDDGTPAPFERGRWFRVDPRGGPDSAWGGVADPSCDGRPDVVVNARGRPGTLLLGDLTGDRPERVDLRADGDELGDARHTWGSTRDVGDVDGDGCTDVVAMRWGGAEHPDDVPRGYLHFGDRREPGARTAPLGMPPSAGNGFGREPVGVGDVDGDGYSDVMITTTCCGGASWFYLYYGGPDGLSDDRRVEIGHDAAHATSAAAGGDVDGDGFDDFVVGTYGPDAMLTLFRGGPDGPIEASHFAAPHWSAPAATADLDGDGHADLALAGWDVEDALTVYFGGPSGLGATPMRLTDEDVPTLTETTSFLLMLNPAGDVNGDGADEVLVMRYAAATPLVTWTGLFGRGGLLHYWQPATAVGTSDVTGDGLADLVIADGRLTRATRELRLFAGAATIDDDPTSLGVVPGPGYLRSLR